MQPFYRIKILTPQGTAYASEAVHTLVPGEDGFVGVLANHAPYVTSSAGGRLEVRERDGREVKFVVGTGFFEVRGNEATLFTQSCSQQNADAAA